MPEVSIIMTSYNYGEYIGEAIDSVIAQDFSDWELIIADDGSTDNSIDIINTYVKTYPKNIRLLTHPGSQNLNISATYELGLKHVKGSFIAFLESDDKWASENLSKKIEILKKYPGVSLVYSDIELFGDEAGKMKYLDYLKYIRYSGMPAGEPYDAIDIVMERNPAATFSNIIFRSECLELIFPPKECERWLDRWFLIQAALKGKFVFLSEKLTYWRIHAQSAHFDYLKKVDTVSLEKIFIESAMSMARNILLNSGKTGEWEKFNARHSSIRKKIWRLKHNLGFAFYSPLAVLRKIFLKR